MSDEENWRAQWSLSVQDLAFTKLQRVAIIAYTLALYGGILAIRDLGPHWWEGFNVCLCRTPCVTGWKLVLWVALGVVAVGSSRAQCKLLHGERDHRKVKEQAIEELRISTPDLMKQAGAAGGDADTKWFHRFGLAITVGAALLVGVYLLLWTFR